MISHTKQFDTPAEPPLFITLKEAEGQTIGVNVNEVAVVAQAMKDGTPVIGMTMVMMSSGARFVVKHAFGNVLDMLNGKTG